MLDQENTNILEQDVLKGENDTTNSIESSRQQISEDLQSFLTEWSERKVFSKFLILLKKDWLDWLVNDNWKLISCYNKVYGPKNGFARVVKRVAKKELCGFINEKWEEVVPCKYDWAYNFKNGFAVVLKKGLCGLVNKKWEEVVPCEWDSIEYINGLIVLEKWRTKEYRNQNLEKIGRNGNLLEDNI